VTLGYTKHIELSVLLMAVVASDCQDSNHTARSGRWIVLPVATKYRELLVGEGEWGRLRLASSELRRKYRQRTGYCE